MILRGIILAAFAAIAATTSLAQAPAGKAPGAVAAPDQDYARQTLAASSMALAISRLAAQKAETDDLKEFAHLEEAEQETLAEVLRSLPGQSAGPAARLSGGAQIEQHLDQRGREVLESLRAQASGPDFDHAYMGAIATGHLELLRIQETYLDSGQHDVNLTNVAKLARAMIKEHLQLLADIETSMDTASAAVPPGKSR
jgi:putative membrane protein